MKIKTSHLIITSITSSILFSGYLLPPDIKIEEEVVPRVIQSVAKEKPQKPLPQSKTVTQWEMAGFPVDVGNAGINDRQLQANLDKTLIALNNNPSIQLSNLEAIAHCYSCLQLLQNYLLTTNLSEEQLASFLNSLSKNNHPEIAAMLLDTVEKIALQEHGDDDKKSELFINALTGFNSAKVANVFLSYLLSDREISSTLQYILTNGINQAPTEREQLANKIVNQFNETNDNNLRNKLLAISQPEALAQINLQALEQEDTELYKQTNELLKTNPSKYTLDVLLSMKKLNSNDDKKVDEIITAAYQLAEGQFSGDRLDYVETKLANNFYSKEDKALILDILTHSEDQERSSDIIAKFSDENNNQFLNN